jgi:hypothetical protein
MVPSWIGMSYYLPVRLSTMVSVSGMVEFQKAKCETLDRRCSVLRRSASVISCVVRFRRRFRRHAIAALCPAGEVLQLAALAAERPPVG